MSISLLIDGKPEVLTLVYSRPGCYTYHTEEHRSAHSFLQPLPKGPVAFRTNGHRYEIPGFRDWCPTCGRHWKECAD